MAVACVLDSIFPISTPCLNAFTTKSRPWRLLTSLSRVLKRCSCIESYTSFRTRRYQAISESLSTVQKHIASGVLNIRRCENWHEMAEIKEPNRRKLSPGAKLGGDGILPGGQPIEAAVSKPDRQTVLWAPRRYGLEALPKSAMQSIKQRDIIVRMAAQWSQLVRLN